MRAPCTRQQDAAGSAESRTIPNKRFLLIYADRSRAHITVNQRDSLIIGKRIRKVNDFTYEYVAQPVISRSFSNLEKISEQFTPLAPVHRNLGMGPILILLREALSYDNGETTEGMEIRLATA